MQPWVSRLWEEKPSRYSRALLETLSLIAYRQPITRGEIEDVRGVSVSSSIMKTLLEREWVRAVGHRDVPGHPAIYGTTKEFLDYFGLTSLDELPTLAELRDLSAIGAELELDLADIPGLDVESANDDGEIEAPAAEETGELPVDEPVGDLSASEPAGDEAASTLH
jgi:segregation and condensation protein B